MYSYGKEFVLGGRNSRVLEKDHAKIIQALDQQLDLKGTTQANKAETLFFYCHSQFLSRSHVDLALLRLSEQFHSKYVDSYENISLS